MKFISKERKYVKLEGEITDEYSALVCTQEILEKIADNMDKNSCLASDVYNLEATKQDVLNAIGILDMLVENDNCYIEYEKEN